nr:2248_t:CDS:2 [Entrophospora candida]
MSAFLLCVDETNKLIDNDTLPTSQTFHAVVNAVGYISCEVITKSMHPALSLPLPLPSHDDAISIVYKDAGLNEVYVKLQIYFNAVFQILVVTLEKYADVENVESINLYDIIVNRNGSRNNSSCNTWDSHTLNCSSIDLILQMKWVQYEISNPQRINQNPINEEIRKETKSLKALDSSLLDIL